MCRNGYTVDLPCLVGVFLQTEPSRHSLLLQNRQASDYYFLRTSKIDRQFNATVTQLCHSAWNACDRHTAHTPVAFAFSGILFSSRNLFA